jgi:hypothetical protein
MDPLVASRNQHAERRGRQEDGEHGGHEKATPQTLSPIWAVSTLHPPF